MWKFLTIGMVSAVLFLTLVVMIALLYVGGRKEPPIKEEAKIIFSLKKAIIGKWKMMYSDWEDSKTLEFTKNGQLIIQNSNEGVKTTARLTYSVIDNQTITWTLHQENDIQQTDETKVIYKIGSLNISIIDRKWKRNNEDLDPFFATSDMLIRRGYKKYGTITTNISVYRTFTRNSTTYYLDNDKEEKKKFDLKEEIIGEWKSDRKIMDFITNGKVHIKYLKEKNKIGIHDYTIINNNTIELKKTVLTEEDVMIKRKIYNVKMERIYKDIVDIGIENNILYFKVTDQQIQYNKKRVLKFSVWLLPDRELFYRKIP
jgi:hypothetical protein